MRALLFGITAGITLSALRAPLGLDLLSIPARGAAAAYGYRAAALMVVALGLFAGGSALDGRRTLARIASGMVAGLCAHALLLGRTPQTQAGAVAVGLVALGVLVFCGRFLAGARGGAEKREGGLPRAGEATALAICGAGTALVLEGLARHLRLLGPGLPAEHGLAAAVLVTLILIGGFAFGRLVPSGGGAALGRASAFALAGLGGMVGLAVLRGLASPGGLHGYLERYGLDSSRAGMADYTALVSAAVFVLSALALGAAIFTLEARRQLAALLLGAAVGLALVPALLEARAVVDPQLVSSAARAGSSAGLVRDGALIALLGAGLGAVCAPGTGRAARAAALALALLACVPLWGFQVAPLPIARPWRERPLPPLFTHENAEGLFTVERSEGGLLLLTLDGRELTPPTVRGALDRRCIELAVGLLPVERLVRGELRVLLVGQLTPGRALALEGLGATTIDRSATWHGVMALLEGQLFGRLPKAPGRVLAPAVARRELAAGSYDLVLVPAVPGEAPATANLASPAGTLTVVWLDGAGDIAAQPLGQVLPATDLEHLALALARGGERRGPNEAGSGAPTFVPAGARMAPVSPIAWLFQRRHEREFRSQRRTSLRLAQAVSAPSPALEALAAHFAAQRHSSPFETRAQRIELEPRSLERIRAAALAEQPSSLDEDLAEGLAAVLAGKRWADEIRLFLTAPADLHWPWIELERALAYAHLEALEPEVAAERLGRLVELEPSDREIWALLGEALLQEDRPAEAAEAFSRALDLAPGTHALERRLAMALVRSGDALGRELVEQLLLEEPEDEELRPYLVDGPLPPVSRGYRPHFPSASTHQHGSDPGDDH